MKTFTSQIVIILLLITSYAFAQPSKKLVTELDLFVQKAMKDWEVPGLAVVVVKDNQVIYKKGLGVREFGKQDPVGTQTLFACASTTKAMVATCMGMLVDEGKVNWNDPVIKHLPDFKLFDPYVTREIKIRDLFTHNTGVGNTDFLWGMMNIPSDEVLKKMAFVKPSYSLRSSFVYQNIFYLAAGKVMEKITGKPWGVFIKERIFSPLAMTRTVPSYKEAVKLSNMTSPHFKIDGIVTIIEHSSADEIGPAGSVWSSIDDMGKWIACMLDSSKYSGGRLVRANTWTELFKPQVVVPESQFYPSMHLTKPNWMTYAFGWFQHDYKGSKVNFHTGSLDGVVAIAGQLPAYDLGVYVFANLDHAELRHAIMYKTFDLFGVGGNRDWSADLQKVYDTIQANGEKKQADFDANRQSGTSPSVPAEKFAGSYNDELYGEVIVENGPDGLSIHVNNKIKASLSHWHYNTFRGFTNKKWWGKLNASFDLNDNGEVASVNIDGLEFKKVN